MMMAVVVLMLLLLMMIDDSNDHLRCQLRGTAALAPTTSINFIFLSSIRSNMKSNNRLCVFCL